MRETLRGLAHGEHERDGDPPMAARRKTEGLALPAARGAKPTVGKDRAKHEGPIGGGDWKVVRWSEL
jgi:hypothetical protein